MSIPEAVRERVRQRAGFACEYCGVTETDTAGQLTLDHFHPRARGGGDAPDNLIYCCHRCNEYKTNTSRTTGRKRPVLRPCGTRAKRQPRIIFWNWRTAASTPWVPWEDSHSATCVSTVPRSLLTVYSSDGAARNSAC